MGRFHQVNEPRRLVYPATPDSKYILQLSPKDIPIEINRRPTTQGIYISDGQYDSAVLAPDQATGLFWRNNSRAKFVDKNKLILVTVPAVEGSGDYDKEIWIDPTEWEVINIKLINDIVHYELKDVRSPKSVVLSEWALIKDDSWKFHKKKESEEN